MDHLRRNLVEILINGLRWPRSDVVLEVLDSVDVNIMLLCLCADVTHAPMWASLFPRPHSLFWKMTWTGMVRSKLEGFSLSWILKVLCYWHLICFFPFSKPWYRSTFLLVNIIIISPMSMSHDDFFLFLSLSLSRRTNTPLLPRVFVFPIPQRSSTKLRFNLISLSFSIPCYNSSISVFPTQRNPRYSGGMSSEHISGGGASKTKYKWSQNQNRPNPMRPVPLVSPSNSEDDHHMLKISLSSISKLEVRNLKRKLKSELDQVRSLIKRFDPQGSGNFRSMAKTAVTGSNKKLKTGNGGGKKGGNGADKGTVQIFKNCNNLLTKLMKHKSGWIFNVPVDAKGLGLHDYHTIVKEPMDLGTVKTNLGKSLYKSPLDFAEDVRLTFNNAILYNPIGHEVHRMAKQLLSMFEEKWAPIEMQYDNLHRKFKPTRDIEFPGPVSTVAPIVEPLRAPTPSPSPPLLPLPPPVLENRTLERAESMTTQVEPETVVTALEQPEEEEVPVNIRDLTLDEKRRLSEELQDLPYDKLETVVQIIKKRNPELSQQDDEIELDIDSVDIETLWELYRFVTGYKESLSKKKEDQDFGTERDAESVHNIIQEPTTLAAVTETTRVTESGKAIRTSSPGVRQENNARGSSSSNSSSSDSGSGSSDYDSGSSSGRGSDTGN